MVSLLFIIANKNLFQPVYRYENGALSSETPEILSHSEESVSIADEYQIVSPTIKLPPREILSRGNPLSYEQWLQFHDAQGRITNSELVKKIIYQGVSDLFFSSFTFM